MMGAEDPWAQVLSEQDPTPVPSVDDSQGNETRSYRTEVLQDLQDHSEYGSAFGEVGSDSQVYGDEARVTSGRQRKKGRRRGLKIVLISVLAVVLLSGGALTYAYIDLNSKLNQEDVGRVLGRNQPKAPVATSAVKYPGDPHAGRAVNILVLGTDSRSGDYSDGARSDTAMVVHVSADRTRVDVVSIPRDTLITIPANCPKEGGGTIAAAGWSNQGFNAAFAWGIYHGKSLATGIACSTLATEALSGLTIDKYVVVNFLGFVDVVDAIGGIDVELLCPIKAPNIGLDLSAGVHHIEGWTSVSLARARKGKGLGDQSDLHRIYRQQKIFDAVIDKVYAMNYFRDFSKLYNLAGAGISSVSTDLGDNLAEIAGFAYSLKNLNMNSLHFVMLPVGSAGNGTNVAVIQSQAKPIWDALRDDVPMPGTEVPVVAEDPGANPAPEDPGAGQAQAPVVDDEPKSTTNGPIVIQRPEDC
ncbi:MAG: LCP family protein [Propionibacteriaceae bacterium]|jgi:LCP family protein required for cell wall assembly|nr:LCP family protein [Propionibacteriaceae bacterium]